MFTRLTMFAGGALALVAAVAIEAVALRVALPAAREPADPARLATLARAGVVTVRALGEAAFERGADAAVPLVAGTLREVTRLAAAAEGVLDGGRRTERVCVIRMEDAEGLPPHSRATALAGLRVAAAARQARLIECRVAALEARARAHEALARSERSRTL